MALSDGEISDGLLLSAVEMGEAVTESGAISAVAGFFRQKFDACAWVEDTVDATTHLSHGNSFFPTNPTTRPWSSRSSSSSSGHGASMGDPHAPPLVRIPLDRPGVDDPDEAAAPVSRRTLLELVVSRGAGPRFSQHEIRISHQAAVLLDQALARIRASSALAETKLALGKSFQGMAEASTAVAVLVDEREQRALRETELRAGIEEGHKRALHAVGEECRRAAAAATGLRRRLVEVEKSVAVLADAMGDCCRVAATGLKGGRGGEGEGGREEEQRQRQQEEEEEKDGESDDVTTGELVAVIEQAAQEALRCAVARVKRNEVVYPGAMTRVGEVDAFGIGAQPKSGSAAGVYPGGEARLRAPEMNDSASGVELLQAPIPGCDLAGPPPLTLSICRDATSSRVFTTAEKALASALAACLGTALLALREKRGRNTLALALDAERKARSKHDEEAGASVVAAAAHAQERRDRTVAGMRALAASAQASKVQARGEAEAARRAEKHANALRHLLAGLDKEGGDHAGVAKVVTERAADAIPACVEAVLLTPRRDAGHCLDVSGRFFADGDETATGGHKVPVLFSPDPRVWAASATAAATAASASASASASGSGSGGGNSRRGGKEWAWAVERAASQAAMTGKAVCVQDTTACVAASSSRIVCFSPVRIFSPFPDLPRDSAAGISRQRGAGGRRTGNDTRSQWRRNPSGGSSCVVALVLCVTRAPDEGSDDDNAPPFSERPSTVETLPADTTRHVAPELPWISHAIEGVVHAVGLALSVAVAADDDSRSNRRLRTCGGVLVGSVESAGRSNFREEGAENAHLSERKSRNRDEVKRLREGASSLAKRVRRLEEKAAGLRASEARSSTALARARADAMALRGELELAALERDRLLRRLQDRDERGEEARGRDREPLVAQQSRENVRGPLPRGHLEGGPYFWSLPSSSNNSKDPPFLMASRQGLEKRAGVVSPPLGATLRSTPAVVEQYSEGRYSSAARGEGHAAGGLGNPKAILPSVELRAAGNVPINAASSASSAAAAAAVASSEALKRMASVHARLSDSLRHGNSGSAFAQKL